MSDDLVKRLRDHIAVVIDNWGHVLEDEHLCDIAADRIEELEAELREARLQSLSDLGQAQDAYQKQLKAEAKLEKAMGAIRNMSILATYEDHTRWVDATLAELKDTDT